jgi:hypothetical protein
LVEVVAEEPSGEGDAAGKPDLVGVGDGAGGMAVVDTVAARDGLGEDAASEGNEDADGTITTGEGEASGDDVRSGLAETRLSADGLGEVMGTMGDGDTATAALGEAARLGLAATLGDTARLGLAATLGDTARLGLAATLAGELDEVDGVGASVVDVMATTGDGEGSAEEKAVPAEGVGEDAVAAPDDVGEDAVDGSAAVDGRGATLVTMASCLGAHLPSVRGSATATRSRSNRKAAGRAWDDMRRCSLSVVVGNVGCERPMG